MKINEEYSVSYLGNSRFLIKRTKYPRFAAVARAENDKWKEFKYIGAKSKEVSDFVNKNGINSGMKFIFDSKESANAYYCWLNLTGRRVLNLEVFGRHIFTLVFPWWATKAEREKYFSNTLKK